MTQDMINKIMTRDINNTRGPNTRGLSPCANYGEFATIKMLNPIKKTKPDSLTYVRGYRESALQR